MTTERLGLKAQGLSKFFGGAAAVSDLGFEVSVGEAVGFLGPNGAGKTTTMRMLTGFLPPDAGSAQVLGVDVAERPLEARRLLGYLPEDNPLYEDLEVTDCLHFSGRLRGMEPELREKRVREAVRRCGLKPVVGQRVWELSKGYRQRLGLAQAILHDPEVLILDEPTSGLDPNQVAELRGLVGELKARKTVLLSTHHLAEAEAVCDRLVIVNKGAVVAQGTPAALKASAARRSLRLTLKAPPAEALRALEALPGASACRDEVESFVLDSADGQDLREAVFELAAARRWPILHLSEELPSLERLFRELTQRVS
jgi:ABC-2 type transport system ATP-binding protein